MRALSLACLLAYVAVALQLHELSCDVFPDEDIVLHSLENGADPCHVAIYHDRAEGCDHDFHLIRARTRCCLCHHVSKLDKTFLIPTIHHERVAVYHHGQEIPPVVVIAPRRLASRAPPAAACC